jgi:uncharacterized membrane protein
VFEALFTSLFSYRPVIFQQGEFRFDPSAGSYALAGLGLMIVVAAVVTLRKVGGRGTVRDRAVLLALRTGILGVVVVCLFRPVMVVKAAVPQQNVLGILLDDSRSMQVADWKGQPRGSFVRDQFGSADRALLKALSDKFLVRIFRFSSTASRLEGEDALTFTGSETRLGAALDAAREELAGLPVSGLVLVSDGADTSDTTLTSALLGLKAEKLPVYTVGVGQETLAKDVQIDRVTTPPSVLVGSSLLLDVTLRHTGYAGEAVTVDVEDEGRIVGSEKVTLPPDGAPATVRLRAIASEPGPRVFRFRVAPQPGEIVTQNNIREATINVRDAREKILYFEGEPRFELKFIRRAVADDKNLGLVSILRTADNKYYRQGVDSADELAAGFPKTREELFAYKGLILGSIEAGAFSGDQLRMISEFVDKRGGGLLMIGGARAFAEGGYAGTPVADVLPVVIDRPATQTPPLLRVKVSPTRVGTEQAVTQIAGTPGASQTRWGQLPLVTSVNAITSVKPGATVLLNGADERGRPQVVLASQRYGRGKTLAFTPQDSWLWKMHASIPLEDKTHENFWRQMLRWLVDGVPGPVDVRATTERVEPGDPVTIEATVADPAFVELNDAKVAAKVTGPDGATLDVPLQWTGQRPGQYRASFPSKAAGRYQLSVDAERGGRSVGSGVSYVRADASDAEYFNPTMHAQVLKRVSEETGGRFYTADNASGLAEDIKYGGRGVTTVEEHDLWHMPIVMIVLLGLMCAEWGFRRAAGLA